MKETVITEKSLVPLHMVYLLCGMVFSFAVYYMTDHAELQAHAKAIDRHEQKLDKIEKLDRKVTAIMYKFDVPMPKGMPGDD